MTKDGLYDSICKLSARGTVGKQKMKKFERICKKFLTKGSIYAKITKLPAGAAREKIRSKKFEKT